MIDIHRAMMDPKLFGGQFGGDSFAAWRALLGAFYGLPLSDAESETVAGITGHREIAPEQSFNELWLAIGRRGGKSYASALVGTFEAAFRDHRDKLAPGEWATVMLIAGDRTQARTLLRYVRGMFDNPMLRGMVQRETTNGLELANRSAIEIHTAGIRAVRGYTVAAAILDEVAFWNSEGANPDDEIIAALRPALSTLGGRLIALSSPYARRGAMWSTYKRHFGQPSQRVLVAQAPSRVMNPTVPEHIVAEALAEDAARASAEWLAEFRADIEQFLNAETVEAAQRPEPLVLPAKHGISYRAFVDPSGGGADEFTLAIGHRDSGRVVVDAVHARRGNPASITAEFAALLKEYRVSQVRGDRYSGEWSRTEFRRQGVEYWDAPGARSELYLSFAAALNAGRVELPPCETLHRQFVGLERRTSRSGRDTIDHAPGAHDDRANAVAGLVASMTEAEHSAVPLCGYYNSSGTVFDANDDRDPNFIEFFT